MPTANQAPEQTRARLLDATALALAQHGPRKVSLTDIAEIAGVSRPTVYRYFASKDELLVALAAHEKERFNSNFRAAVQGLSGSARLGRALRFIVEFQRDDLTRRLVEIEPRFMLAQFEEALTTMAASLVPLFEQIAPADRSTSAKPADLADLVVRTALSHHLLPGRRGQLLRELRHIAGLPVRP